MPLFTFKCPKCNAVVEVFMLHYVEDTIMMCKVCGVLCVRQFSVSGGARVELDAKTLYAEKIKPEADRISKQISEGNDSAFLDICGEK